MRRQRNPWNKILKNLMNSGKDLREVKIPISITAPDIQAQFERQEGRCYWLGIKLNPDDIFRTRYCLTPSIDRLDNSKSYVLGNFVLCARFANLGRGALTIEQFIPQVRALRKAISNEMWPKFLFDSALTAAAENPNLTNNQKDYGTELSIPTE